MSFNGYLEILTIEQSMFYSEISQKGRCVCVKRIELLPSCQNLKREEMHLGPLKNGVQRAYNENTLVHNIMCGVSLP